MNNNVTLAYVCIYLVSPVFTVLSALVWCPEGNIWLFTCCDCVCLFVVYSGFIEVFFLLRTSTCCCWKQLRFEILTVILLWSTSTLSFDSVFMKRKWWLVQREEYSSCCLCTSFSNDMIHFLMKFEDKHKTMKKINLMRNEL